MIWITVDLLLQKTVNNKYIAKPKIRIKLGKDIIIIFEGSK